METSDSEYFESADEDFESDVDDTRHKLSKVPGQSKVIEPELCKLKLDDTSEPLPEDVVKPVRTTTPPLQVSHIPKKDDDKPVRKTNEPLEVVQSSTEETNPDTSESLPQIEKPSDPKLVEDNLWDDDELDWGSEAAKEADTLKSEDNGWNDFDTEWDSQSQSQTIVNNSDTLKQSSTQENLWQDDGEWEPLEKPPTSQVKESNWGGWGGWGVTSLLTTATQSVTTLTSQVSHVLESSIGIPQPEELAKINTQQEQVKTETDSQPEDSSPLGTFGLGSLVKFVESTGTKVISGGLDTLEAIGKKTVEVLQEGDPGLKKKRAFLKLDTGKPNLSQILREAKEKAEQQPEKQQETKKVKNYETLFDDHQGLVHLEALEMLSKLCSIKLDNLKNSLSGDSLREMQETLEQVKELCELSEDDDDNEKVTLKEAGETVFNAVKELNIPITYGKFFDVCEETNHWLDTVKTSLVDDVDIYQQAMDTLAQLTAICMEQYHKAGELLMVKEHRSTADEADSLVQYVFFNLKYLSQFNQPLYEFSQDYHHNKTNYSGRSRNVHRQAKHHSKC